jgi:hypothetical protein
MTLHQARQTIKLITTWAQALPTLQPKRSLLLLFLLLGATSATSLSAAASSPGPQVSRARTTPTAVAAREMTLQETGSLHLISHHHEQLVEVGHGTGTLSGNITIKMTLTTTQATISFTAYPSTGGTVVGHGEGLIYAGGHTANFSGNAAITGGTGKYARASGNNIRLKGTLQRKTFALYVQVEGKMRY